MKKWQSITLALGFFFILGGIQLRHTLQERDLNTENIKLSAKSARQELVIDTLKQKLGEQSSELAWYKTQWEMENDSSQLTLIGIDSITVTRLDTIIPRTHRYPVPTLSHAD